MSEKTSVKIDLGGRARKALVSTIATITGEAPVYRSAPTFAYDIGDISVSKEAVLTGPVDSHIVTELAENGFFVEGSLQIYISKDGMSEQATRNLCRLIANKAGLIAKALGTARLVVVDIGDRLCFPWWDRPVSEDEKSAYTSFLLSLAALAENAKRVNRVETKEENSEKYAFRCFLLRLGFIGPEHKAVRKILLRRLTGSAAFRAEPGREKA